jgi:hypothetical protein
MHGLRRRRKKSLTAEDAENTRSAQRKTRSAELLGSPQRPLRLLGVLCGETFFGACGGR